MTQLITIAANRAPTLISAAGERAAYRYLEFFTAQIRNPNTRRAYARAVGSFLDWLEAHGVASITEASSMHVAAYVEQLTRSEQSAPTVKQQLAAIRRLFDWMAAGGVRAFNPASAVRGPGHSTGTGSTPVLDPQEARQLLEAIDIGTPIGLRDRALTLRATRTIAGGSRGTTQGTVGGASRSSLGFGSRHIKTGERLVIEYLPTARNAGGEEEEVRESTKAVRVVAVTVAFLALICAGDSQPSASATAIVTRPMDAQMTRFQEVQRFNLHGPIYSVAWSADGKQLAVLEPPYLDVFNAESLDQIFRQQVLNRLYSGKSLQYTSTDKIVIGGGGIAAMNLNHNKYGLRIFDIEHPELTRLIPEQTLPNQAEDFYPQDNFILSTKRDKLAAWDVSAHLLYIYNMKNFSLAGVITAPKGVNPTPAYYRTAQSPDVISDRFTGAAFSPDGTQIAACSALGRIYFITVGSVEIRDSMQAFPEGVRCTALSYSPDGQFLAVGRQQLLPERSVERPKPGDQVKFEANTVGVKIYNLTDRTRVDGVIDFHGSVRDLAWIPETNSLVFADDQSLKIVDYNGKSNQHFVTQDLGVESFKVAISSSGRIASVQGTDVVVYDSKGEVK